MPSAGEIFIVSGVDGTIAVDELDVGVGMSSTTIVGPEVKAGTSSGEG